MYVGILIYNQGYGVARDETVIRSFQAGDRDALKLLVQNHEVAAQSHAMVILRNREDALDAVQDAFLDVYRGLDRFDVARPFLPWFYTILRNRCYKLLSKRKKNTTKSLDAMDVAILEVHDAETNAVESALATLSPQDREVLTLKHLDGLTYKELAERMEIPIGTVMSRLYDARRRLREKLEKSEATKSYFGGRHD